MPLIIIIHSPLSYRFIASVVFRSSNLLFILLLVFSRTYIYFNKVKIYLSASIYEEKGLRVY